MVVASVIASVLLALVAAASGVPKVLSATQMIEEARHLGVPRIGYVAIGTLELAAGAGLLAGLALAPLGVAAAGGLLLMMAGAIVAHARAGDRIPAMVPAFVVAVASALTLGLRLAAT
jgi:hypothetical protein